MIGSGGVDAPNDPLDISIVMPCLDEAGTIGICVAKARSWLDNNLTADQALIFVSHDPLEIPRCITKRLTLEVK